MKKAGSIRLSVFTVISTLGYAALAADPLMTSLSIGSQSPKPLCGAGEVSYPIIITRSGNGNMEIYLKAVGLPADATAAFTPSPVLFTGTTPSATAMMVVTTAGPTPPGLHPFSVIATDGASHNSMTNTASLDASTCSPGTAVMANGCILVTFSGTPGSRCLLQATTNLAHPVWTTLCTTNFNLSGLLAFADLDSTNYPSRFYRLSLP